MANTSVTLCKMSGLAAMSKARVTLILFIVAFHPGFSQLFTQAQDASLKRLGENLIKGEPRTALSIGVLHKGIIYSWHLGTVRPDSIRPPSEHSVYQIGSVTKTFTSLLAAKAIKDGKMNLMDDVRKYLHQDFPNLEYNRQPIKIIHLVNLTSGLPDNLSPAAIQVPKSDSSARETERLLGRLTKEDFFGALRSVKLDTLPGYYIKHSNTAAQLLRYILEVVYNKPIETSIRELILGPLQMNATSLENENRQEQWVVGYDQTGNVVPWFTNNYNKGNGGMRSSTADLLKYVSYLMSRSDAESVMVLKKNVSVDAATNRVISTNPPDKIDPTRYSVSFNWYHYSPESGKTQIWTDGSTPGFSCYVIMYPDSDLAITLLANKSSEKIFFGLPQLATEIRNQIVSGK